MKVRGGEEKMKGIGNEECGGVETSHSPPAQLEDAEV